MFMILLIIMANVIFIISYNQSKSKYLNKRILYTINNVRLFDDVDLNNQYTSLFKWTGLKVDLGNWSISNKPINKQQEDKISKVLVRKGEYCSSFYLSPERQLEIKEAADDVGMDSSQALSLRKQLLVSKIIEATSKSLQININKIQKRYHNNEDITKIAIEFDIPPVAMIRHIITDKINKKYSDSCNGYEIKQIVKNILKGDINVCEKYICVRDYEQLISAKLVDQISYSDDGLLEKAESKLWEDCLYKYLDKLNISYISEDVLINTTLIKNNEMITLPSTPDVVLLDDVYINNKLVRWIDSKSYYGSTSSKRFFSNIMKQSSKYDGHFGGTGAVIYKLGYSVDLPSKLPNTLVLDRGPL